MSLVSETVAVFNGGDFKCQNHDNHREGYTMIQQGPRQECMWRQSYALFIYVALKFYSASIILHNINNNISYKVIPLCRSKYFICNSSGSNYINSMLNLMNFSYEKLVHFFISLILILCILKKMNITLSDRFHLLVYWLQCIGLTTGIVLVLLSGIKCINFSITNYSKVKSSL